MMDAAEAYAVADLRFATFRVGEDVGSVEQAHLLEPTDRALVAVGGQNPPAEPCLVNAHLHLARGIPSLNRIVRQNSLALFEVANHLSLGDEYLAAYRVVIDDEAGIERPVPTWARPDEVDNRHPQCVCGAQRAVVGLVDFARSVGVQD